MPVLLTYGEKSSRWMVLPAERENLGGSSSAPERCPEDHNCEAPQRAAASGETSFQTMRKESERAGDSCESLD